MQINNMYGNAKQGMDDKFHVQKKVIIILGGISQTNHHLLILDGHGSHVTLKTIKQV